MDKYIEMQAAADVLCDACGNVGCDKDCSYYQKMQAIPAADVRPVVRGTWVGIDDFPHDDWECDHCGCVVESTNDPWNYYHFCPNCGADMREES